jgi:hypothetical protein
VLHYLLETQNYGIRYYNSLLYPDNFIEYVDTAFTNNHDMKSTSRYIFIMRGGTIIWRSKKQTIIALSSIEVKYIAISQFHKYTKHIAICWHWDHDLVWDDLIYIRTCRDKDQTADVLTKAIPHPKHNQHRCEMGLVTV